MYRLYPFRFRVFARRSMLCRGWPKTTTHVLAESNDAFSVWWGIMRQDGFECRFYIFFLGCSFELSVSSPLPARTEFPAARGTLWWAYARITVFNIGRLGQTFWQTASFWSVLLLSSDCLKIPFHGPFGARRSDAVGFGRCSSHTFATVLLVQFISYYYSLFGSCDDTLVTRHRTFLWRVKHIGSWYLSCCKPLLHTSCIPSGFVFLRVVPCCVKDDRKQQRMY